MADIAKLQIVVDSSQVKTADTALNNFQGTASKTEKATAGLSRAFGSLRAVVAPLLAAFSFTQIVRAADRMTLLEGRVQQSTRSVLEFSEAWEGLNRIALTTGGGLQAGVNIFQRLSLSRNEIKASIGDMLQFTETVTKLGVVGGASTDALKFGLTQLGQSLSSDIMRAEEFNSIMENIPTVGKAIADEFGITTGQLRRLVVEGKVLSGDVFSAILNQAAAANEQFEKMPMTISRAWQMLLSQFDLFAKEISDVTSANELIAKGIIFAKDRLTEMTAVIAMLQNGFKAIALTAEKAFNDALLSFQNFYNKAAIAIEKISFGKMQPELMTSAYNIDYTGMIANLETDQDVLKRFGLDDDSGSKASSTIRQITTDYKGLAAALSETDKEAEKAAKKLKEVTDNLEFNIAQLGRSNVEQAIYNNLRAAGVQRDSAAGRQIENLTRTYEGMNEALEDQKRIAEDLAGAFTDAFSDAVLGAESFGDALSNLFKELQKIIFQMTVLDPLKKSLTGGSSGGGLLGSIIGGIGSFFGGGSSLSSSIAAAGARGAANPALFGPGFATGGSFTVGGSGGVDSQQVAFRATPGEMVNITRPGQSSGGGSVYNYSIDARGASPGVENLIKEALLEIRRVDRSIEARSTSAVREANKRNPNFMKAT